MSPGPRALPVRALVLAARVRVLVRCSIVLTLISSAASWADGNGLSAPALLVVLAHVGVQAGVVLPVQWQFAGDPAARQARAVRAITVAFVLLAVLAVADAATALAGPHTTAQTGAGVVLGCAAAIWLRVSAVRSRRGEGAGRESMAWLAWPNPLGAVLAILGGTVAQVAVGPEVAVAAIWCVLAGAAARQALAAWRPEETSHANPAGP